MTAPTVALCVPHTPWRPERVASFERLRHALGLDGEIPPWVTARRVFSERAPNHVWAAALWNWGAEQEASHLVQLQDDVIVSPNFWPALRAMIEAVPDQVIGLEAAHPAAPALFAEGRHWYTTSDGLVGVAWIFPTAGLRAFRAWCARGLRVGAREAVTEDMLIGLWCLATGRRVWHPIPTIIDHDTSLASTYGNDAHPHRRPAVTWTALAGRTADLELAEWWAVGAGAMPPHLGHFYESSPALAAQWVAGFSEADRRRASADDGRRELRRLSHAARAKGDRAPAARILVCTPTLGSVHPAHSASVARLVAAEALDVDLAFELVASWQWTADLVRVRSRFVRAFLESDATHLLFVDGDVSFEPRAVLGMLAAGREFVAAPYPKRGGIEFARVAKDDGRPPEARAYGYKLRTLAAPEGATVDESGCIEVAAVPLGAALLSRACLATMVDHYRHQLEFDDQIPGGGVHPTTALFQLLFEGRELLSEDYSFCSRWRALGGRVWLYLGPGSPVTHHGDHAYRGHVEAFGLTRVEG